MKKNRSSVFGLPCTRYVCEKLRGYVEYVEYIENGDRRGL